MASFIKREIIVEAFRKKIAEGKPVIGFGAGCAMTAKCGEKAGADYISIYTTAICRIEGVPSLMPWLPYGNVNDDVYAAAKKILPLISKTPCVAGVGVHDPRIDVEELIDRFTAIGFSGVNNEPFCSMYGEKMCAILSKMGIGFNRELELMETARRKGVFTLGWAANQEEAVALAQAGTDVVGLLASMDEPGESRNEHFQRVLSEMTQWSAAAKAARADVMTLAHGGPLSDVKTAQEALRICRVDGYATGSSGERIPAETAITETVRGFCGMELSGHE